MNLNDKISNPLEVEFFEKESKIIGNYNFLNIDKQLNNVKNQTLKIQGEIQKKM